MKQYRILITGSRDWHRPQIIEDALTEQRDYWSQGRPIVVVHGGARGADQMAEVIARRLGFETELHRAHWNEHGKAAGFIRNQEMIDLGADVCLAFIKDHSRGASHCARKAFTAGIKVVRHELRSGVPT